MFSKDRIKRLPLKTTYYLLFVIFIVIPILVVLAIALLVLNQQFKSQAIETIKRSQEAVIAELESDEDVMSMRLSHMIYTNNNEILRYAAEANTIDLEIRNQYEKKLYKTVQLVLEPVKEIISVGFYMKDSKVLNIINDITRPKEEIRGESWYQKALEHKNRVQIGYYDTKSTNDLYMGSKKDSLILVFALAPDVTTDRSQKIEMVMYYQSTRAADRIKSYNQGYQSGKNKLGISKIVDGEGNVVFSTYEEDLSSSILTCVKTPIRFNNTTWYIENYIKTSELTADYWNTAIIVLSAAILVLALAGYYSRYFLRSIVKPIEEISTGLKTVEEGNLEVHIDSKGQFEIRTMIHQFNAMVRRLKLLVEEYEEKIKGVEKNLEDYFGAMIVGEMKPEEVNHKTKEFFLEPYTILGIHVEYGGSEDSKGDYAIKLANSFGRNPRFSSRCVLYMESSEVFYVFYRIREKEYSHKIITMAEELQKAASQEFQAKLFVCIGEKNIEPDTFMIEMNNVKSKMAIRHLTSGSSIINLETEGKMIEKILKESLSYEKLANVLYIADEKNATEEKEKLFSTFNNSSMDTIRLQVYGVILAIGSRFSQDESEFSQVFGHRYDYFDKVNRIEEIRSMKLWLTNYFAWILDYSATKLQVAETDVTIKAKRYMVDNYEDADLSLIQVAEHVGLNEKYFTNRFTKETGETFSSYLTSLRIQKAKELLKTTNFKIYEIAEMVGYYNVEHFNRMFKKLNDITPNQYRKSDKN